MKRERLAANRASTSRRRSLPRAATPSRCTRRKQPVAIPAGAGREIKYYDAGFDAVWELDFFGRIRRNIEARNADLRAAEADLHDAQVVVIAEVARTYFELRGQQSQLDVARRNVTNQQSSLDLTKARLDAGRGTELDTSRAQAQLSATLGTIAPLEAAVARSIHRLSVLTGREPTALTSALTTARSSPSPQRHRRRQSRRPAASSPRHPRC